MSELAENNWLVLAYESNPVIRLDACLLDRVHAEGSELVMEVGSFSTALLVDGPDELATQLLPFTRSAPLTTAAAYRNAKHRLQHGREPASLYVGPHSVHASDDYLYIGTFFVCTVQDVLKYAHMMATIPVCEGSAIQAGLAMLMVEARKRREDLEVLAACIAAYEAQAPTTA